MIKKGRIFAFFIVVILLAGLIGLTIKPVVHNIKLGLDLQGGFEVLYHIKSLDDSEVTSKTMQNTVTALRQRIDVIGVNEPRIAIESGHNIRVDLAGVDDQNKARELLSTSAHLTFRDVNDNVLLDGSDLVPGGAKVEFNSLNEPVVALKMKNPEKLTKVTKKVLAMKPNNKMVIWLDYEKGDSYKEESKKEDPKYISAPNVDFVLSQKDIQITGQFTIDRAHNLADILNAGALPVKLTEIYSTSVGAQFGQQAMHKTLYAGYIGIAVIFLFMLLFYRFGGLIANISLVAYIYLVVVIFNGLGAVLTLPGIAALILGVGMAVDANIITLERIKEEIKAGKSILSAFKSGNRRSLGTIMDANITTVIAAAVMFVYGTSSVKGFAVMLIVSIAVSFITAVFGSRLLLSFWVHSRALNKKPGYFGVKKGDIDEL